MNWCGALVDGREAPLLRAHGAAMGASLVVLVVRHVGRQLTLCTSLNTGPCRSGASSEAAWQHTSSRSRLAVHPRCGVMTMSLQFLAQETIEGVSLDWTEIPSLSKTHGFH